jgi:hypothetical protein
MESVAPWEFGWDALVAIGTLALAIVTGWLAFSTRSLARESAADIKAQWRPVILPGLGDKEALRYENERLEVRVVNADRGPALFVRATLDPHGLSPDLWHLGSLAPGSDAVLNFGHVELGAFCQVLLDYRDLAGRTFSSALVIDRVVQNEKEIRRFYDVRLIEGHPVTDHGDALPQAGLRPLPAPSTRR